MRIHKRSMRAAGLVCTALLTTVFVVTPASAAPARSLTIENCPRHADVGVSVPFAGHLTTTFAGRQVGLPFRSVQMYVDGASTGAPVRTDLNGAYAADVTLAAPGIHQVYAVADAGTPLETTSPPCPDGVVAGYLLSVTTSGSGTGTVTSSPSGIDCGQDCQEFYAQNTVVTLTSTSGANSMLSGWSGACSGTGSCLITLDADKSVNATFNLVPRTLTAGKSGTGDGTITSAPAGVNCGATCSAQFAHGTVVTLTASPDANSTFSGWSGACSGAGSCSIALDADKSVTATFTWIPRTLTVTKGGTGTGTVTSSPSGIDCGSTCSAQFAQTSQVTLTASPDTATSFFAGWSGACSGTGSCVVTMGATDSAVTATFTLVQRTLTASKSGTGNGTITSAPAGINCGGTCSAQFPHGTVVTLTATPDANSTFAGWSGACTGTGSCVITMDADKSVTATFNLSVTISKGASAQGQPGCSSPACRWVDVTVTHFPANKTVTIVCRADWWPNGFWTYYPRTDGAGNGNWPGNTVGGCYYGYPGTHLWVTVDGATSNVILW